MTPGKGSGLEHVIAATQAALQYLYQSPTQPHPEISIQERNNLIRELYQAGETLQALARQFGISHQRVHQIVHNRRK